MKPWTANLAPIVIGAILVGGVLFILVGPRRAGPATPGSSPAARPSLFGGGIGGREMLRVEDRAAMARRLGRDKVPTAVPYLIAYLKDPDPEVRAACAWALGQIGDRKAAIDLKFRLDNETDEAVRPVLEEALALLSDETAIRMHLERLASLDPKARLEAVNALAAWRDKDAAVRGLVRALADEDPVVHRAAARHIVRIGSVALHVLGEGVRSARPGALEALVAGLSDTGAADAVPALLAVLGASDPRLRPGAPPDLKPVRDAAVDAIVRFGDMAVAPLLDAAFEARGGTPAQAVAAEALGRIGTPAVSDALAARIEADEGIPAEKELGLWTGLLKGIGGPEADDSLVRITLQVDRRKRAARLGAAAEELEEARMGPPGAAPHDLNTAVYVLVLDRALPGGKPLAIHLDRVAGRWATALATALRFSKVGHQAEPADLGVEKGRLAGEVRVTLCPDPWVLKEPVPCRFAILAAVEGADVKGRYKGLCGSSEVEGTVWGLVQVRRPIPNPAWVQTLLEQGLAGVYGMSYHHRTHTSFFFRDGRTYGGQVTMWDQRYPNTMSCGWSGVVEGVEADLSQSALHAKVHAIVSSSRGPNISWGRHTFVLDGKVVGRTIAGTFETQVEGAFIKRGGMLGIIEAARPGEIIPASCRVLLDLEGVPEADERLEIPIVRDRGAFKPAIVIVHGAPAALDPTGLRDDDGLLRGDLKLAYPGPGGAAVACLLSLDLSALHPRMSGTFKGRCGSRAVAGPAGGTYLPNRGE